MSVFQIPRTSHNHYRQFPLVMAVIAQGCVVSGVFLSRGKVLWKLTFSRCFLVVSWLQLLVCTTSPFWNFFSAYFPIWKRRRHTETWMDLEDTTLSDRRQSREEIYHLIPLTRGTWSSWIHRDREENDGCQGLREGEEQIWFMWTVSVREDENIPEMDGGDDCITKEMYIMPQNCTLKSG